MTKHSKCIVGSSSVCRHHASATETPLLLVGRSYGIDAESGFRRPGVSTRDHQYECRLASLNVLHSCTLRCTHSDYCIHLCDTVCCCPTSRAPFIAGSSWCWVARPSNKHTCHFRAVMSTESCDRVTSRHRPATSSYSSSSSQTVQKSSCLLSASSLLLPAGRLDPLRLADVAMQRRPTRSSSRWPCLTRSDRSSAECFAADAEQCAAVYLQLGGGHPGERARRHR